MYPDS